MYETSLPTVGEKVQSCKPDYEKVAAIQKAKLTIVENFKRSLLEFISVIGSNSFARDKSSIPELLGTVELDILNRNKQYERTLSVIEKEK